jgi:hypothetical protein
MLLANPAATQGQIATHFGYTQSWVSQLLSSDAVKEYLIERKVELMDPILRASMENRLDALAKRSMDVLQEKLDLPTASGELALKALEISTRARGYGVAANKGPTTFNFVVAMPEKAVDGEAWTTKHRPAMITVDSVIDA